MYLHTHTVRNISAHCLCVIQFADSHTFICNSTLLGQRLDAKESLAFVNVNKAMKIPQVVKNVKISVIYMYLRVLFTFSPYPNLQLGTFPPDLYSFIFDELDPFLSSTRDSSSILAIPSMPKCMVSISGWLLEYPVIYFQDDVEDDRGNCLGNVDLRVCSVYLGKQNSEIR